MQSPVDEKFGSETDRPAEEIQRLNDLDRSSGGSRPNPKNTIGEKYRVVTKFLLKWGVEMHG